MTPVVTKDLLRRLPKAELHVHLDGSVRPSTLLELGREYGVRMPADDPEALAHYMHVRDAASLEEYLERFAVTLSVMQRAEALERIAYELAEDAAREGVRYIEIRYSPVLNVREGLELGEVVEAPLRGLERAERDHGIIGRVIVTAIRSMDPQTSLELAKLAVSYQKRGVVGFDLAGGERGNPAGEHVAAFEHSREHGLMCTCHAGEGDGADSVREAIHMCGAQRIGHATRLIEDPKLLQDVNERGIPLEICLSSNVQTRAAATFEEHPLRTYFDAGLIVVLNTDNRLMSGTTLVDEYALAAQRLDFGFEELSRVALNGFHSSFLPEKERDALVARMTTEMQQLSGVRTAGSPT